MDIEPISHRQPADSLAAWMVVREAMEALAPPATDAAVPPIEPGTTEAVGAQQELPPPALAEAAVPGANSDFTHEAAAVQTVWRAPTPAVDVPHRSDESVPAMPSAQSEFAVPASLLVPAMVTGLRVEPALGWVQLPPSSAPWPSRPEREQRRQPRQQRDGDEPSSHDEPAAEAPAPVAAREHDAPTDAVLDAAEAGAWCEALTHALRAALAARVVPQALLTAADQWKRGRCVVLACPQGADPAGPAWAFVLWPLAHGQQGPDGVTSELALRGLRVEARLQWSAPPHHGQWCHVRVVREHHPRTGRQLVSLDDDGAQPARKPVPCEVQLGPVLARSLRWCEVRVRIQAAQRFWSALGAQWSLHVVVSARPLLPAAGAAHGEPTC